MDFKHPDKRMMRVIVIFVAALLLLPWAGNTHFNTKGEPREAIVAVSMLQSGDWILPESYGEDIPYKPPMLAWCIAGASALLNDGHVSEYTSRLPSALAAIALVVMTFNWVARRRDTATAALTAMVTLTAFEVFRNAAICRVDMLLTFFMVGAIVLLDTEGLPRRKAVLNTLAAVVFMGLATLTKGPVGALLACLIVGIWRLLCGRNFFKTVAVLTTCAIGAFAIATVWYYAAYLRGGDSFLSLALEENIGRLTGTMTYDSHLNPWWYNIMCVLYGMLPYTIVVLCAAVPLYRRRGNMSLRHMGPDSMLALCAAVLTIGFYCIPASKRSSYLLPAYPFMALGVVLIFNRLQTYKSAIPKGFARFVGILAVTSTVAVIVLRCGVASVLPAKTVAAMGNLATGHIAWWQWIMIVLPAMSVYAVRKLWPGTSPAVRSVIYMVSIYSAFLSTWQPLLLNGRSNIGDAQDIAAMTSDDKYVYSYMGDDPYIRYYSVNFYLDDRMRRIDSHTPSDSSLLLVNAKLLENAKNFLPAGSTVEPTEKKFISCDKRRDTVSVYRVYLNPNCSIP